MSKKYKDKMAAEKEIIIQQEFQNNNLNNSNIDVYDYCDKMMKDLSQFDKSLENG